MDEVSVNVSGRSCCSHHHLADQQARSSSTWRDALSCQAGSLRAIHDEQWGHRETPAELARSARSTSPFILWHMQHWDESGSSCPTRDLIWATCADRPLALQCCAGCRTLKSRCNSQGLLFLSPVSYELLSEEYLSYWCPWRECFPRFLGGGNQKGALLYTQP